MMLRILQSRLWLRDIWTILGKTRTLEESRALYTSVVQRLFQTTSSNALKIDIGILIAVQALGLFELFVNAASWLSVNTTIDIPTLLERTDQLSLGLDSPPPIFINAIAETLVKCSFIEGATYMSAQLPKRLGIDACFWETLGPRSFMNDIEKAFPGVLHFTDLKTVQPHQLYWTALVTLYGVMHKPLSLDAVPQQEQAITPLRRIRDGDYVLLKRDGLRN